MITVIARMKNQNIIKVKKQISYQLKDHLVNSQVEDDIKAKNLYINFRDM